MGSADNDGTSQQRRETGANVVGALVSAASSLLLPAPLGPLVGAATGPTVASGLKRVFTDVAHRQLSDKERQRVDEVVSIALATISRNLDDGKQPRSDWYGSAWPGEPLPDDPAEISEGVLIAAQREHEARKVAILGRILGNLAFTPKIDRGYANALVRAASELTYQQFCLLLLLAPPSRDHHGLPAKLAVGDGWGSIMGVMTDMFDLYRRTMVQQRNQADTEGFLPLNAFHLEPNRLRTTTGPGGWLVVLGELETSLPAADIESLASLVRLPGPTTTVRTPDRAACDAGLITWAPASERSCSAACTGRTGRL